MNFLGRPRPEYKAYLVAHVNSYGNVVKVGIYTEPTPSVSDVRNEKTFVMSSCKGTSY